MAEQSPRPAAGDDSEEDGEEAAEAPLLDKRKHNNKQKESEEEEEEESSSEEEEEEEEEVVTPTTPDFQPKDKKASPPPKAPRPLLPTPPAFHNPAPTYPALSTPAAPAFPSTTTGVNAFANDGSFLELFKKKMEQSPAGSKEEAASTQNDKKPEPDKRKPISFVGKRRGGAKLALKTGLVAKKPKSDEEVVVQKGGAWAQYMAEVKKYKAHQCSDDDKTRPLVK